MNCCHTVGVRKRLDLVSPSPSKTTSTRATAVALARQHRGLSDAHFLALARKTLASADKQLAYELLRARPSSLSAATLADVRSFAKGMASWSDVDCFGCFVAGVAWRLSRIGDHDIARYARSRDRWRRRAALVATVPLNAKARGAISTLGDAKRTLAVCTVLVEDRDDMVVKAMSWALRELAKRDSHAVRAFLDVHLHRLAPRVRREVLTKLTTGRKSKSPRRHRKARS
jgi:3-methyladenine DNA glycosylase AlkD